MAYCLAGLTPTRCAWLPGKGAAVLRPYKVRGATLSICGERAGVYAGRGKPRPYKVVCPGEDMSFV